MLSLLATYLPSAVPFIRDYDTQRQGQRRTPRRTGSGLGGRPGGASTRARTTCSPDRIYGAKVDAGHRHRGDDHRLSASAARSGSWSGYFRGWPDRVSSIFTDSLLAMPGLLLALIMVFRLDDLHNRYSWLGWVEPAVVDHADARGAGHRPVRPPRRAPRRSVLREREFVLASRSLGAGRMRIMTKEILPNLIPSMVTIAVHRPRRPHRRSRGHWPSSVSASIAHRPGAR